MAALKSQFEGSLASPCWRRTGPVHTPPLTGAQALGTSSYPPTTQRPRPDGSPTRGAAPRGVRDRVGRPDGRGTDVRVGVRDRAVQALVDGVERLVRARLRHPGR